MDGECDDVAVLPETCTNAEAELFNLARYSVYARSDFPFSLRRSA